jgi:hypothetical protein
LQASGNSHQGDAVLIEKALVRFYGTIDLASIPPSENVAYKQVVLNPLRRYATALETMLTQVRDRVGRPADVGGGGADQTPKKYLTSWRAILIALG